MMSLNRYNFYFIALLVFHFSVLCYIVNDFSLSYKEVLIYFNKQDFVGLVSNLSTYVFTQNDFFVRFPYIIFYTLSGILLFLLTDDYFKKPIDRIITLSIFMILPGVNSAALLLNESIIVIFCTLLYLYLYKLRQKEYYALLFLFLFIDNSFAILYLALFFYSLKKKDNILLIMSLILFGLSMSMYGFEIGGRPRGYFLDTFAIYASIFSPLLFLYFFYALYRVGLKFEKDMYWYIAMTALILSFIFSLRQKIAIEDFAPFVVIAVPIMVKLFMHSVRVRLEQYRKNHIIFASFVGVILVLNFIVFVFNKSLYIVLENPQKHFAYDYHIAKELANELRKLGISYISTDDMQLAKRLEFYGINTDGDTILVETTLQDNKYDIKIEYFGKVVAKYDIETNTK